MAACVAAAPGQPTHVLESDQVAEHIPGCNMAFRREALETINGFDPQYRKAGDDVDICWRLQHEGYWITFSPGAFVWHHRRQNPRTYLRQQAGYGQAEALLRFKHPDKFNGRGDGKLCGVMYGASLRGLRLAHPVIYRGTFGTGLFQTIYRPGSAHWAMLPGTLEWHLAAALLGLVGFAWHLAWVVLAAMVGLSLAIAGLQAAQARLATEHDGIRSRLLVVALCYLQPLRRSWARYCTRLLANRAPLDDPTLGEAAGRPLPPSGRLTVDYWDEAWRERTELLDRAVAYLNEHCWGRVIDSGWFDWDLIVDCYPWNIVQVCTVQEDHGSGRRLIRIRYRLRPIATVRQVRAAAGVPAVLGLWPVATAAGALLLGCGALWWRGTWRAARIVVVFDRLAREMGMARCDPSSDDPAPIDGEGQEAAR